MATYGDEKRRRIEQFAQHLRLMGLRRQKVVKGDCFTIFDESAPAGAGAPVIKESVAIRVDCLGNGGPASGGDDSGEIPLENWSPAEPFRFIQVAFRQDCFYMELPNSTLFRHEAELILQQRPGFYWAKDRPDLRWVRRFWKDMLTWDPLQKIYLYHDEESAAEDMAFIMFQVWKFPVDWRWYIKPQVAEKHGARYGLDGRQKLPGKRSIVGGRSGPTNDLGRLAAIPADALAVDVPGPHARERGQGSTGRLGLVARQEEEIAVVSGWSCRSLFPFVRATHSVTPRNPVGADTLLPQARPFFTGSAFASRHVCSKSSRILLSGQLTALAA